MIAYPFDAVGNYSDDSKLSRAFSVNPPDITAPTATITNPATQGSELNPSPTLNGTITDNDGGSGIQRLAIAIYSSNTGSFVDLDGNAVNSWTAFNASVPAGNPQTAQWSLDTNLPIGGYTMTAYPFDAVGNYSVDNKVSRTFSVQTPDLSLLPTTY